MNEVIPIKEQKERVYRPGRWNTKKVADLLRKNPHRRFQPADLLEAYGAFRTAANKENARGHLSGLYKYMSSIDEPIVREFGERGRVLWVKYFDPNNSDDCAKFRYDLERARDTKEISDSRYEWMVQKYLSIPRLGEISA